VLSDAKTRALELARAGYEPPVPRTDIPAPGENLLATLKMGVHMMRQGDFVTDYEVKLGGKIAEVLCGGNVTPGTPVSEQYILDLEREGFKSLCGEKKTQERIQYTLRREDAEELRCRKTQADSATIPAVCPEVGPAAWSEIVIRVAGYPPSRRPGPLCETQSIHLRPVCEAAKISGKGDAWKKMERGCDCA